jgi:hypothetical protein
MMERNPLWTPPVLDNIIEEGTAPPCVGRRKMKRFKSLDERREKHQSRLE